jgi:hypothetical protein
MTTINEEPSLFEPAPVTKPAATGWKTITLEEVTEVFDAWKNIHGKKRAVLSPERHRVIAKALVLFGREMVLDAVEGCSLSDWHMGRNPRGKLYNDVGLILRDAAHVEGFAELVEAGRSGGGFLGESK